MGKGAGQIGEVQAENNELMEANWKKRGAELQDQLTNPHDFIKLSVKTLRN